MFLIISMAWKRATKDESKSFNALHLSTRSTSSALQNSEETETTPPFTTNLTYFISCMSSSVTKVVARLFNLRLWKKTNQTYDSSTSSRTRSKLDKIVRNERLFDGQKKRHSMLLSEQQRRNDENQKTQEVLEALVIMVYKDFYPFVY